jgi:hypothetical protein
MAMLRVRLRLRLRVAVLTVPLAAAAVWAAGCSHKSDAAADGADADAGALPGLPPPPPPAADAAPVPSIDCSQDTQADGLPTHLVCTGLYADIGHKTIAPGIRPYTPGVQFWSDGAEKARFLLLPPGGKIDDSNVDEWVWPSGTTVWKELALSGKRIETRVYKKVKGTWSRTAYRWNDAETDAVRRDAGETVMLPGAKAPYEVPAGGYCDQCHEGRLDALLGLEPVNLGLKTAQGVTLASLAAEGAFTKPLPETSYAFPDDPALAAGTAPRALAWLHVNCGVCHNANTNATATYTNLFFLAKASQLGAGGVASATGLDAYTRAVCVKSPDRLTDSGAAWTYVAGGNPDASLASVLSGARAVAPDMPNALNQMPPIVSHLPDDVGHAMLDDWIRALPICP